MTERSLRVTYGKGRTFDGPPALLPSHSMQTTATFIRSSGSFSVVIEAPNNVTAAHTATRSAPACSLAVAEHRKSATGRQVARHTAEYGLVGIEVRVVTNGHPGTDAREQDKQAEQSRRHPG